MMKRRWASVRAREQEPGTLRDKIMLSNRRGNEKGTGGRKKSDHQGNRQERILSVNASHVLGGGRGGKGGINC